MVRALDEQPVQALRALPGVELVTSDFSDPASVGRALADIELG